jgi:transcriptional regulator with XRE-family HTH domain
MIQDITENSKLTAILAGIIEASGRGGAKVAAVTLGVAPSYVSKIKKGEAPFNEITIRALQWLEAAKDESYAECKILKETTYNGYLYRTREIENGEVITWTAL